jgi:FAD/FMN-containing dehydrogenase
VDVLWRGDDGYDEARVGAVWNVLKPDRYPAAIVQARTAEDVVEAVRLARERGLKVKARSGGHSWTSSGIREGALLVDVGGLDGIEIDGGTAFAGPGAHGRELNRRLEPHGFIFPTGHCPTVGLGGFLLQGGWGWNSPCVGPACLSVTGVDVVTSAGEVVHADETTNTDLLWAARGAGPGFFGIVTRFELRCHPRAASMMASIYVYPLDVVDDVVRWALDLQEGLPPEVELVMLGTTPREGGKVVDGSPALIVAATVMFDTDAESVAALKLLESCPVRDRALVSDTNVPMTMDDLYELGGSGPVTGFRWAVDNMWTDAGADELVPALRELFLSIPTPASQVFWMRWREQEIPDAALSITGKTYIGAYAGWSDPADDARCVRWGPDHMRRLEPLSNGIQLADENLDARPEARFMSDENLARLEALRAQWDPDGLFLSYLIGGG